ncbi:MAG: hypothetical protein JRI23_17070, partial [Deltaproteobacteria bacterium]|nr:hypothetical protein [Deltaproteobacteria bacterium]MBW2533521.1 hypothetical protein [Deltaproteobacteria bacterium]
MVEPPPQSTRWPSGGPSQPGCRETLRSAIDRHGAGTLSETLAARRLGPYRGYAEVLRALDELCDRGARLTQIGRSASDEPLFAVHLGPAAPTRRTRTTVLLSGLHPMEWICVETQLALLERLVDVDLGARAVVGIVMANPDGRLRVEEHLRAGRLRLVRHNARGVDLNRNFDAHWGRKSKLIRFVPWLFRPGNHPASEPEVAAIAHALGARRVDRAVSLHSFGGAVLVPSAHRLLPVADDGEHRRWARYVARSDGRGRGAALALPCSWFNFGLTQGGFELDWFHQRHGALSLLIECPGGGLPTHPSRLVQPFAWFNPREPAP